MLPLKIRVVEVGPRDGLQNESVALSIDLRTQMINRLTACGFSTIEAGSLVSPRAVPQLADSEKVFQAIHRKPGVEYPMLVGNRQGMDRAIRAGLSGISVFCAATETFSIRNNHCSIAENFQRIRSICNEASSHAVRVRAYVSCALGCPYEGKVEESHVADIAAQLVDFGCFEISLADTIGVGTAGSVGRLLETVKRRLPSEKLAVHFHDTYGQALANVLVAIQSGITVIDSSVGGLGGCPFAGNASGNLASEDLIYMLDGLGIESGVDLKRLVETSWYIADILGRKPESRVARVFGRKPVSEFSEARPV